jgi:rubrerythrin
MRATQETGTFLGRTWVRCTYCSDDGMVHCGGLPPLECPVCFGSKHDFRDEKQRARDSR